MYQIDDNYRYQEVCGVYGEVKQRWIIVYSQKAYDRDLETLNRQALKGSESERKAFDKLCRRAFACEEDAMREWEKFQNKLHYTEVHDLKVRQQPHYTHRGKPKQGEAPERVDYFLTGSVASCLTKRDQMLKTQGLFVLATNELDTDPLPAPQVLCGYKGQLYVEKGYRFLKSPEFLASAVFLKKPERIMALLMVMTLCLMVYAALEYRIREKLKEQGLTVLNQVKKPTNRPTARWIFHWFVGVNVLYIDGRCLGVLNLEDRHWQIISLLGYQDYYT